MTRVFTWLLLLGVFAGLWGRVITQGVAAKTVCVEVVMSCGGHDHDHDHEHSDDEDHGPQCPSDPHHHHQHGTQCFTGGSLVVEDHEGCRLAILRGQRIQWSHGDEPAPDGPVFSMDKPPLI